LKKLHLQILRKKSSFLAKVIVLLGVGNFLFSCSSNDKIATGGSIYDGNDNNKVTLKNYRVQNKIPDNEVNMQVNKNEQNLIPVYNPDVPPAIDYGIMTDYGPYVTPNTKHE
jgi:hypothetical protein